jgi:hypothetical protein
MVLLQHKLSVKLSQRQILTPGLVQMVSVLALNKLELKDMINAEMVENPVLEELEESVPLIDEVGRKEEDRDRLTTKTSTEEAPITAEKKDPFEEIDFGSFFQDYLDPGYRTRGEMEEIERPSFENFLSKPTNSHRPPRLAAGRAEPAPRSPRGRRTNHRQPQRRRLSDRQRRRDVGRSPARAARSRRRRRQKIVSEAQAWDWARTKPRAKPTRKKPLTASPPRPKLNPARTAAAVPDQPGLQATDVNDLIGAAANAAPFSGANGHPKPAREDTPNYPSRSAEAVFAAQRRFRCRRRPRSPSARASASPLQVQLHPADLQEALEVIRQLDPPGVGCRTLRECLLRQLRYHQQQLAQHKNGE